MSLDSALEQAVQDAVAKALPGSLEGVITRFGMQLRGEHRSDRLKIDAVADRLGVSIRTVRRFISEGRLRAFKDAGHWYVLKGDLWDYNESLANQRDISDIERDLLRQKFAREAKR